MPVIYSQYTGNKGFQPCSRTYRKTILQALQQQQYGMAQELFQQGHKLMWTLARDGYVHRLNPRLKMSVQRYQQIEQLDPQQITPALLDEQCGAPRRAQVRPTAFVGPQLSVVRSASTNMQRVQSMSYEAAARDGYPVQGFKGLALYAPSPFQQEVAEDGVTYRPVRGSKRRGNSAGRCNDDGSCSQGLVCQQNTCVVPPDQRTCPPFQYPVELRDAQGQWRVQNPSARRTVKKTAFSPVTRQYFNTCVPSDDYTVQRWVEDPRLRRYIGLAFDVRQLPAQQWSVEAADKEVLRDPATNAPYFLQPGNGVLYRVYKLNSAYTPVLARAAQPPAQPELVAQALRAVARNVEENEPGEAEALQALLGR